VEYIIDNIKKMKDKTIFTKEHKLLIKKLKKARMEAALNQNKVAKLLNKTQSYVSKVESGQRRVDIIQLKEFTKIYNKNINYFLEK